jgi:hypothetical protein
MLVIAQGDNMGEYGQELHVVTAGSVPTYRFIDHDEYTIRLQLISDLERYLLVDKQALRAFAEAFSKLAKKFTV